MPSIISRASSKYNNTKLKRAEKRALKSDGDEDLTPPCKCSRSQSIEPGILKTLCCFCGEPSNSSGLHEAATFQVDKRVGTCAELLEDTELLAKLSTGDMVALDAKYHTKCLVKLYNRARKVKAEKIPSTNDQEVMCNIAFAELVMYIEETRSSEDEDPIFKLSDLAQLYVSRMEQLGISLDQRIHTTRLKDRLLAQFTDMRAQKRGEIFCWPLKRTFALH